STDIDDPRWVGSGTIAFGDGGSNIVEFRSLQDTTSLYFAWRMRHVPIPLAPSNTNLLYFGFQRLGLDPLIVEVNIMDQTAQSDVTGGVAALSAFRRDAGGVTHSELRPAWLAGTGSTLRVWVRQISPTKPQENSWAVQVQIPRSAVQFTGGQFKLWFDLL